MKKEFDKKIELKDLGVWLKISVIGWLVYLGLTFLSLIVAIIDSAKNRV